LTPKDLATQRWDEVSVDLIGLWTIKVHGIEVQLLALAVDTVTILAEIISIVHKTSAHVAMKSKNEWLSRYPCLSRTRVLFASIPACINGKWT
jgi:hypothetical protein